MRNARKIGEEKKYVDFIVFFFSSQVQESKIVYRGTLASCFPRDWEEIRFINATVKSGFCF